MSQGYTERPTFSWGWGYCRYVSRRKRQLTLCKFLRSYATNSLSLRANSAFKGSRTPRLVEHFWVPILGPLARTNFLLALCCGLPKAPNSLGIPIPAEKYRCWASKASNLDSWPLSLLQFPAVSCSSSLQSLILLQEGALSMGNALICWKMESSAGNVHLFADHIILGLKTQKKNRVIVTGMAGGQNR